MRKRKIVLFLDEYINENSISKEAVKLLNAVINSFTVVYVHQTQFENLSDALIFLQKNKVNAFNAVPFTYGKIYSREDRNLRCFLKKADIDIEDKSILIITEKQISNIPYNLACLKNASIWEENAKEELKEDTYSWRTVPNVKKSKRRGLKGTFIPSEAAISAGIATEYYKEIYDQKHEKLMNRTEKVKNDLYTISSTKDALDYVYGTSSPKSSSISSAIEQTFWASTPPKNIDNE